MRVQHVVIVRQLQQFFPQLVLFSEFTMFFYDVYIKEKKLLLSQPFFIFSLRFGFFLIKRDSCVIIEYISRVLSSLRTRSKDGWQKKDCSV